MARMSTRVAERIKDALKRFQPILASAKDRDVNESDTVVLVTDLLQYLFGYDKYLEITSEHMIRGTYCDLAIKLDGKLQFLIEVKAIGLDLKENHVKQAVDYAANQGCEWVCLTNGIVWRTYKVRFGKPIEHDCIVEFDLLQLNPRNSDHVDLLGILSREGWTRDRLAAYQQQREALSRFTLGALLLSEDVIRVVRRELRRLVDVKCAMDEIKSVLQHEVVKREVQEGERAQAAARQLARAGRRERKERERSLAPQNLAETTAPGRDSAPPPQADLAVGQ